MRHLAALLFLILMASAPLGAQRVDSTLTHTRVLAIDRVVTDENGRRPAHAAGMLGFVAVYGPGDLCLVEYVAARHEDLAALRAARERDKDKPDTDRTKVRVFEKGRVKRSDFEAAARAAGFTDVDFDRFFVRVP